MSQALVFNPVDIPQSGRDLSKGALYFHPDIYSAYARVIDEAIKAERPNGVISQEEVHFRVGKRSGPGIVPLPRQNRTPYDRLPAKYFWRSGVVECGPNHISGLYEKKFPIQLTDKISTCGSCFAQNIGRHLRANGFSFTDFEPAPVGVSGVDLASRGYGLFSARFGNVYTARQLVQLFERSVGDFVPVDPAWEQDGRWFDPFRAFIEPDGFSSREALETSRAHHFACVRRMFRESDVFVFTLGLTEAWFNRRDGAVYSLCPGASGRGVFDEDKHEFRNFDYNDVYADLCSFLERLWSVNPGCRVLFSVSPQSPTATMSRSHVVVAGAYTKAVLRSVAGALHTRYELVDYFPCFEMITAAPFSGMFYQSNFRQVSEQGVRYVMANFFEQHQPGPPLDLATGEEFCDEALLDGHREGLEYKAVHGP
jgi:hypothetical protein